MSALDSVRAFYLQHRTAVIGTGVAGVAGLALFKRRSTSKTAGVDPTPIQAGNPAAVDTTAYDGADQFNQELSAFEDSINARIDALSNAPTPVPPGTQPPPVPAPQPSPAPVPTPTRRVPPTHRPIGPTVAAVSGHPTNPPPPRAPKPTRPTKPARPPKPTLDSARKTFGFWGG